jgi:FKBP-type peptidyl-prolyl cis-trans isomerase SlyD
MSVRIENDRVVTLAYRLTDADGRLIEERTPDQPFIYLHGRGAVVGPVERALVGKTPGFRAEITVTPREGYGSYDPSLVVDVPRASFPAGAQLSVDMRFNTKGPDEKSITVRVVAIEDDFVTLDGNHPLAGLELLFELRVLEVREATETEIEAGRAFNEAQERRESGGTSGVH